MIDGTNEDDVARAVETIKQLLIPMDDDKNIHKQKQMRQLALLNGLHDTDARCPYCGMTATTSSSVPTGRVGERGAADA